MKFILLVVVSLVAHLSFGQYPYSQNLPSPPTLTIEYPTYKIPKVADTCSAMKFPGTIICVEKNIYYRNQLNTKWILLFQPTDTLISWHINGAGAFPISYGIGGSYDTLKIKTNGVQRLFIPPSELSQK